VGFNYLIYIFFFTNNQKGDREVKKKELLNETQNAQCILINLNCYYETIIATIYILTVLDGKIDFIYSTVLLSNYCFWMFGNMGTLINIYNE